MSGPAFRIGAAAPRSEFRATDVSGRPVDPGAETPTQHDERVRMLQDLRLSQGPREAPATDPRTILVEWMAQSPANRMSAFAMSIAADPRRVPQVELEPRGGQAPAPGGLVEKMTAQRRARGSAG